MWYIKEIYVRKVLTTIPLNRNNNTFQASAVLGAALGKVFLNASKEIGIANDAIMEGENSAGFGNIHTLLRNGAFLNFSGPPDDSSIVDAFTSLMTGYAVNALWRQQVSTLRSNPCLTSFFDNPVL